MPRKETNNLIDMATNGMLDWETIARACLCYMSEADVSDMAVSEGFTETEDEETEDETEYEYSDEDEVREAFGDYWESRCAYVPAYRTDKPAKQQLFSIFVDDLQRDGRISEDLANDVTLSDDDDDINCDDEWNNSDGHGA